MYKRTDGSIVVVILGLLWLVGIMTAVLYAMVASISTLAELREIQTRYWYALEGGMITACAHMQDNPEAYAQHGTQTLYEGPWPIDQRHPTMHIMLTLKGAGGDGGGLYQLTGTLVDEGIPRMSVVWYLQYNEVHSRWDYQYGDRSIITIT
jgi:hypothetical protein